MKDVLAIIAAVLAIAGNLPYIRDAFTHRVKPHPFTWLVWTIVSAIVFFGQLAKGAGIGALPAGVAELFTIIIFIFSLQYGFKYVQRTDKYFLAAALFGIIPWLIFDNPTISVIIAVVIDLIAFVPTLRKTYEHPETETPILYGSNVLRHILTLFSLQAYNIATTLHSIAMIITNTLMVGLISKKKIQHFTSNKHRI
ncbi:MAG: hypothetical protein ACHQT9_05120 [Candidatus Saccharimonadales bacterium]